MKPETQVSDVAERLRNEAQRTSHEWNLAHSHMCEEAADLIERQQKEIDELRERSTMLQSKLWTILKDRRDISNQSAENARHDLEWAIKEGLNSHLPTIEDVIAAGPYVRVGWDESYDDACARAEKERQS
jgi:hypothetical protein